MLMLPRNLKIYVAVKPIRMGLSFDGLSSIVKNNFGLNPFGEYLFVFFNNRRDKVKIFYWDANGYAIWYKRLEEGVFRAPRVQEGENYRLSLSELNLLLEGVDLARRDRFENFDLPL
jgi:transposase